MMTHENDELQLSQLADGELTSDQANELLLSVLDEPLERTKLRELLRLRQATLGWRSRTLPQPVMVVPERPHSFRRSPIGWRVSSLAIAACFGGLLVFAGVWAAGFLFRATGRPDAPTAQVSPEVMQQLAKAFALHESVAGPLAWYAADDQNIRLASADSAGDKQTPIGVLIKLESPTPGTAARTLVVVCRNDEPAIFELPPESGQRTGLRVSLTPRTINGKVDVQYAIAVDGQSQRVPLASLSGQRRLGLSEASLGQLAMGDYVLNIEAAAWPMRQEPK